MIVSIERDKWRLLLILGTQSNLDGSPEKHLGNSFLDIRTLRLPINQSLAQETDRLRLVNSTHTLHLPFFFFTTSVFASHSRKKTSLITLTSFSLFTSCFTVSTCSFAILLGFCFLCGYDGSTLSHELWTLDLPQAPHTDSKQKHPNFAPTTITFLPYPCSAY